MENDAREEENVVWGDPGSLCCLVLCWAFFYYLSRIEGERRRDLRGTEAQGPRWEMTFDSMGP